MAKHSKERTQAEAQFKRTQKAQRATESGQAMADYVAAGHAVRVKDRSVKRTSVGQRGGRQDGQVQARHKIEIALGRRRVGVAIKAAFFAAGFLRLVGQTDQSLAQSLRTGAGRR
jgi:hypothetical protein